MMLMFCLYVLYFFCQGHVTAYFGFPTMPGMNDIMFLMIPTWLGDERMYRVFW